MRGRGNVWRRTATLEQRHPRRHQRQTDWNLDALTDTELELLLPLAEKQEHEDTPVWTGEEQALLARLWAKAGTGGEVR